MRSLCSRECDFYEAADILLGEHLYEKSDAVQWISVERPDKRKVRIKDYQELQQIAESDPDSNDLYQANLIDNFYPNRPASLGHVCLYDVVKWYHGVIMMQKVRAGKPKIPNHRIYDPNKPDEREAYFYSLLLLFVPFTVESQLVGDGQQKKRSMSISGTTVPWNIITKVCKRCFKHKQRCKELMKLERRKKCLQMKMQQLKMKVSRG